MTGRPVRLLTAAAIAAAASLFSIASASAGCYGCGSSYTYAAPVAYYTAPVVYSYSYAAPAAYAAPSCGCGGYAASYQAPMYVVNQGPSYNAPVTVEAEQEPAYEPSYRRGYSYYGEGGPRWRHRHWHRGLGYRGLGYRGLGYRHGYRGLGYRGFRHSLRYNMRHPMVGPGGIYRPRHATGLIPPRHFPGAVSPHRMGGGQMHMMRTPGAVHPRKMP